MKKYIALIIFSIALLTPITSMAQRGDDRSAARHQRWEQFRQEKHEFYARMLELTDEQAAQFFPLFDEMEKKKFEAAREVRREARTISESENVTDEQYKAAADRAAALAARELAIEKEYYAKFCQILTPRQQFLYHRCDHEFQKHLINKKKGK